MSHFSVLVIGDDVEKQLAPFHEYECTGYDDQYVQEIEIIEEALAGWNEKIITQLKDSNGKLYNPYDDQFQVKDPNESKTMFNSSKYIVPEGFESVKVPLKDTCTFHDYIESYYGYNPLNVIKNGREMYGYYIIDELGIVTSIIKRTNPNAKWDWWVIGGRYSNRLLTKDGKLTDSALFKDVDWEGMRAEAESRSAIFYDDFHKIIGDSTYETWETIKERHPSDINVAREEYRTQPILVKIRENNLYLDDIEIVHLLKDRETYVTRKGNLALTTFAAIKNDKWYERGEMGWWAMVSDEKNEVDWCEMYKELLNDVSSDTPITVVDCHI